MRIRKVDISEDVAAILRGGRWEGVMFHLPEGQLDRALYAKVDKVLRALGGRWSRSLRAHGFDRDAQNDMTAALDSGAAVDQRKTMEQYFTPPEVAEVMAALLDIRASMMTLEPSAGDGALVRAAVARGAAVVAIELDYVLAAKMLAEFNFTAQVRVWGGVDFMAWGADQHGDKCTYAGFPIERVIMNPPFGQGADMAHVLKAYGHLAPGGRLAAIMSPHWTFAGDRGAVEFRKLVEQIGGDWQELPPGTFRSAGTLVRSGILLLDKPA